MPKNVLVSFVILNWNGLDDTLRCLDSIRQQTIKNFEVIVVDNGSTAEQKAALRSIKDIGLIDFPKNTGFTGGQIAAYKTSSGKFIALINNDAVIAKDWAEKAVGVMRHNRKAAALGGRAYQWDEEKGQKPFDETSNYYSYQVISPISAHAKTVTYGDSECRVNSISGSGVLIRRKAIEQVGYFYNRFFAYYEETDLFARFKRAGWQIIYSPDVRVWHQIAKSTRSKPRFYLYQMHRNRFIFALRNFDSPFLGKFIKFYTKEFIRAAAHVLRHRGSSSIEQRSLCRAFAWNLVHLPATLAARMKVRSAGKEYSLGLLRDKGESISVVIPCYNYGQYVSQAIESVLGQTLRPDEIIVVNDGSTDDSLAKIKRYKDDIEIIDQKNSGVIAARNNGLKVAKGDWIIFLDADDTLDKKYIEKLYAAARINGSDVVYAGMKMVGHAEEIFESRPFTERSIKKGNYINNAALMKRELVVKAGGYKKEMDLGYEDWELYISLAELGAKFRHVNEPLLYYRRHQTTSRDLESHKHLLHAHRAVRKLHPGMFTLKHRIQDVLYTLLTFHQRRSLWQMLKDIRYISVKRLDRLSERSALLNKSLGFARLLSSGRFGTFWDKIMLNLRRILKNG